MQIHPIDFRYGTPEMKTVWSEENRFCCVVSAETALVSALASCGIIPEADANAVSSHAHEATLARAKEIEAEIGHDLMGMVKALSEVCGEAGRYVHFANLDIAPVYHIRFNCNLWRDRILLNCTGTMFIIA